MCSENACIYITPCKCVHWAENNHTQYLLIVTVFQSVGHCWAIEIMGLNMSCELKWSANSTQIEHPTKIWCCWLYFPDPQYQTVSVLYTVKFNLGMMWTNGLRLIFSWHYIDLSQFNFIGMKPGQLTHIIWCAQCTLEQMDKCGLNLGHQLLISFIMHDLVIIYVHILTTILRLLVIGFLFNLKQYENVIITVLL